MTVTRLTLVFLLVTVGGVPSVVRGQTPEGEEPVADTTEEGATAVVERVDIAFSEGDASQLLIPSADRVEISLFGTRTYYSSAQALYVMREFFRSHVPDGFEVVDVMETTTTCFVEGRYRQARVAEWLNVYVRLGQIEEDAAWQLQEVSIETTPE